MHLLLLVYHQEVDEGTLLAHVGEEVFMEIRQISSLARPGTSGLDVFKIAGRSISGFLPSFKTGDSRQVRIPFTKHL